MLVGCPVSWRLSVSSLLLDSPLRVVLEVVPEKWISFDADKSARDRAGELREDEKTPRLSADTDRMNSERAKRGLDPR